MMSNRIKKSASVKTDCTGPRKTFSDESLLVIENVFMDLLAVIEQEEPKSDQYPMLKNGALKVLGEVRLELSHRCLSEITPLQ